ncbi:C-terminal binding protein [bacterium]|nr:C-terminal binding protein [Pirellulales bacterium]NBP81362.1 C-terminal binding protein [bacterium]
MHRVVITDFLNDELEAERRGLEGVAEVEALDGYSEDDLIGRIEDAAAIMMYHNLSVTKQTIDRLECCRLIVRCGAGIDNVDHVYARSRGIAVANVPDYGTEEVADSAIGMMLALVRGVNLYNVRLRNRPDPWMYAVAGPIHRLRDQQLGIVGLGRIGTAVALRAKALGMRVGFYDPYKADGYDKALGITRYESVEELFKTSSVLSTHCPLTDETTHLVNAESLHWLPEGAFLVNTARGGVVDTVALPDALARGQLAGAAIDVLVGEPPADDNPLLVAWRDPGHPAYERLIINPHAAFYSVEGLLDMRTKGTEACRRALLGLPLRNIVN